MKRSFVFSIVCAAAAVVTLSASAQTNTIQIPVQGTNNTLPKINNYGEMAWTSRDASNEWDVFYFDGRATTRLLTPKCYDRFVQINNSGQIVWEGLDSLGCGVYFFDGVNIARISDPAFSCFGPKINDSGDIVWCASGRTGSSIHLYRNGVDTQIPHAGYTDINPQINENGYVAWTAYAPADGDWDIYVYDGTNISRIENPGFKDNMPPQINDNGDVAWASYDGTDWDICVYDGTEITYLDSPDTVGQITPEINNAGEVTWCGFDGTDWEVFLYDGESVTQLTDNELDDMTPQINDDGVVVWRGNDGTDWEIFAYQDSVTTQLTDNDSNDSAPQVNSAGDVVWMETDGAGAQINVTPGNPDITPPTISSVAATPDILWPPNHQMVPVSIQVSAADEEDAAPVSRIVSVACNEADYGDPDWILTGDLNLELRAERLGISTSRIYTITVECEDESGNASSSQVTVTVPHDRRKK